MIANWMLSIISCYLACFDHRFSSYVAFSSRTSAGSLPRARARVLAWLMPQGSVPLLCLIGIEGARAFLKICSATTIRFVKTKISTSVQLFCDCGLLSALYEVEMGRCASDLPLFRGSIRVLTPRGNPQSQKSCNFGRISVFGHPDRPHAGVAGGVSRAQRLCGRLGQRFAPPLGLGLFRLPHLRALLPSSHRSASCTAVS